jgi:hypothetical protein
LTLIVFQDLDECFKGFRLISELDLDLVYKAESLLDVLISDALIFLSPRKIHAAERTRMKLKVNLLETMNNRVPP